MGGRIDPEARNAYCREYRKKRKSVDPAYVERVRSGALKYRRRVAATADFKARADISRLKHRYGITPEWRDAMAEAQGYICAACERFDDLVVDHDHKTEKVRGLLCHACNVALGLMRDDPERLEKAAAYLRRHQCS